MDRILIGTSGYDYPEWKGVFYPQELKRSEFLEYYATRFNALELNNTFYSMPDSNRIQSFIDRSKGKLTFSIKANRLLTHEISPHWKNASEEYKNALIPALERDLLSAVLFQFPQSFHYTVENRRYLAELIDEFKEFPVAVEFRNAQWIKDSVFEGIIKRNASVVFCDMPELKHLPNADFNNSVYSKIIGNDFYLRLHGRNKEAWYAVNEQDGTNGSARYDYDYSEKELKEFVPVIEEAYHMTKRIQVYFNNHPNGSGAKNGARLKELLKK